MGVCTLSTLVGCFGDVQLPVRLALLQSSSCPLLWEPGAAAGARKSPTEDDRFNREQWVLSAGCLRRVGCLYAGWPRCLKNLIGHHGVLHSLHPQCGCSSVKMCEQRTWTVCCFLLGPKPVTLESIGYQQ